MLLARLNGPKALKHTRHGDPTGAKLLDVAHVLQPGRWNSELQQLALNILTELIADSGQALLDMFVNDAPKSAKAPAVRVSFNVNDPRVQAELRARSQRIVNVNKTTATRLRDSLAEGDLAGETVAELSARVRDVMNVASTSRARMIARTEVASAHNVGQLAAARQSGVVAAKEWLAVGDHRTRASHLDVDGTVLGIDALFTVGGDELEGPGDVAGSAEEVVNCRCVLLYHDSVPDGASVLNDPAADDAALDDA